MSIVSKKRRKAKRALTRWDAYVHAMSIRNKGQGTPCGCPCPDHDGRTNCKCWCEKHGGNTT